MASRGEYGAFVPTTQIWDLQRLANIEINSPEFRDLLVRLYQNVNLIANVLNIKDSGYYVQDEFVCGQVYFPNPALTSKSSTTPTLRQVFRKTINFGPITANATNTVPHGIPFNSSFTMTRMYGTASNTTSLDYIPIPYATATTANIVELSADGSNVYITAGSGVTGYNVCYVILEYIKQ